MSDRSDVAPTGWHAGEVALQAQAGVAARMAELRPHVIRRAMPDQHRAFFAALPFIVAGSVDAGGDAWATILSGEPGFVASPAPTALRIAATARADDPARAGLHAGAAVGLLGIELHTRRRNRANGTIGTATASSLQVEIEESFGNCPKFIQRRETTSEGDPAAPAGVDDRSGLDAAARAVIEAADTFFVASYSVQDGRRQVDVSHRGGRPGFVHVGADGLLTIPDFSGNRFFMSLGNILVNGKAGLLFVDFATGDTLQITGDAAVVPDAPEIAAFEGAERLWTVRPRRIVRRSGAAGLRWTTS